MANSYVLPMNDPIMHPYATKEFKMTSKRPQTPHSQLSVILLINEIESIKVKDLIRNVNKAEDSS